MDGHGHRYARWRLRRRGDHARDQRRHDARLHAKYCHHALFNFRHSHHLGCRRELHCVSWMDSRIPRRYLSRHLDWLVRRLRDSHRARVRARREAIRSDARREREARHSDDGISSIERRVHDTNCGVVLIECHDCVLYKVWHRHRAFEHLFILRQRRALRGIARRRWPDERIWRLFATVFKETSREKRKLILTRYHYVTT
mmetsp:Transcript_3306/g.11940  ORF Transcript_3306/g.11940 Transcript_3306/m.11940 type:complete len:200 (+) Transcript_3306:2612-3211(+)